ncbi:MAG: acetylglutamate kinase [Verrucomicrobia bacterium]|nr:acetylglutamate kinase [Verrucomicrobiota bacterium]MBU1908621.1 acetylglutamate kinase [Verrucomicrobiota bacterium]
MQKVIEKADVLIEALPYIQRFRGDAVVVKFGGSAMEEKDQIETVLKDIAFMECVGMRPVVVHGGGKAISQRMKDQGLRPIFVKGLRVTDAASIEVVEQVLNNEVNPGIVRTLEEFGCKARGIHGEHILSVVKRTGQDKETGEALDWGYVGEVTDVDVEPIKAYLLASIVPVITPLGQGPDGKLYNINADEVAAAIAEKMEARKLVFLSDVPGVLMNPDDPDSIVSTLKLSEVEDLIKRGIIHGGMLPKIGGALKALKAGVRKTHIIDAALPHSLLLELFTDKGVGTEIIQ